MYHVVSPSFNTCKESNYNSDTRCSRTSEIRTSGEYVPAEFRTSGSPYHCKSVHPEVWVPGGQYYRMSVPNESHTSGNPYLRKSVPPEVRTTKGPYLGKCVPLKVRTAGNQYPWKYLFSMCNNEHM